jgi:hypothetical protein
MVAAAARHYLGPLHPVDSDVTVGVAVEMHPGIDEVRNPERRAGEIGNFDVLDRVPDPVLRDIEAVVILPVDADGRRPGVGIVANLSVGELYQVHPGVARCGIKAALCGLVEPALAMVPRLFSSIVDRPPRTFS